MMRFFASFLLGVIPALLLLVLRFYPSDPQAASQAPPAAIRADAPPDPNAYEKWRSGRADSPADSLRFLESLDTEGALAFLDRVRLLEDSEEKPAMLAEAFERFAELDLHAALEYARTHWPLPERVPLIRSTLLKWAAADIDACWEWIARTDAEAVETGSGNERWAAFLRKFYKERAYCVPSEREVARTWEALERRSASLRSTDRFDYIDSARGVFDDPLSKRVAGSLWTLANDARVNRSWGATLARLLALPETNSPVLVHVAHDWLANEMEDAIRWASQIEDPSRRNLVFGAMRSYSFMNGERSSAPFDQSRFFDKLAEIAPDQAVSAFDRRDPVVASEWLARNIDTLPNPDSARHHLATALVKVDINAAKAWAESISGEVQRKSTTMYVAREWSRYEPWAAKAWAMATLGWTEEECAERLR